MFILEAKYKKSTSGFGIKPVVYGEDNINMPEVRVVIENNEKIYINTPIKSAVLVIDSFIDLLKMLYNKHEEFSAREKWHSTSGKAELN